MHGIAILREGYGPTDCEKNSGQLLLRPSVYIGRHHHFRNVNTDAGKYLITSNEKGISDIRSDEGGFPWPLVAAAHRRPASRPCPVDFRSRSLASRVSHFARREPVSFLNRDHFVLVTVDHGQIVVTTTTGTKITIPASAETLDKFVDDLANHVDSNFVSINHPRSPSRFVDNGLEFITVVETKSE
jgi:hypothetical protein